MRRAVSEFPNDNPELHDGLVWSAPSPCAPALPTLRLRAPEGPVPKVIGPSWVPVARPRVDAEVAPEPPPASPFEQFVLALSRVLLERGATRAALGVRGLFGLEALRPESFEPVVLEALRARNVLERDSVRPTASFSALAAAWRGVLEGTTLDLSSCGATTLDAWAAGLLGALVNAPRDRTDDLRRELRKRGVAAFGLLAA
jgi:hypothetical protein